MAVDVDVMSEETRPWTWRDHLVVVFYGAPLYFAASLMLDVAGFFARVATALSRANNRLIGTFRPGSRRVVESHVLNGDPP